MHHRCLPLLLLLLSAACTAPAPGAAPHAGLDVADAALTNGAPALALSVAQTDAARHPEDPEILLRVARAQAALGRWAQARASYERVLSLAPNLKLACMELGRMILFSDPARAQALFARVTEADDQNAAALDDQGIALDMLGRHTAAQASYRRAIASDPTVLSAQVNLALSLAMSGELDRAIAMLRPIAAGPEATPRIRRDLALVLVRAGHDDEAAALLRGDMSSDEAARIVARDRALLPGNDDIRAP